MIIDQLSNADQYHGLGERVAAGLRWLVEHAGAGLPDGRCEIDGEAMYALAITYEPRDAAGAEFEAHQRYLDIQYVVSGVERMGWADLGTLTPRGEYDADSDARMFSGEPSWVTAAAGTFIIFKPQDGHIPGVATEGSGQVRKLVVKVRVA